MATWVPDSRSGRILALVTLLQSTGIGLFLTSGAIFFVTVLGLSPAEVGTGLSIAGFFGFLSTVPSGRLSDRLGRRPMLVAVYASLGLLFVGYGFVRTFAEFLVLATLIAVGETAGSPLRAGLTHDLFGREDRVRVRAQVRSFFNLGFGTGALIAAVPLAAPSTLAFRAVTSGEGIAMLVCALLVSRLPPISPCQAAPSPEASPERGGGRTAALRDRGYLLFTGANGFLELHHIILTVGLPLWIVVHTAAPRTLMTLIVVVNTMSVMVLQVWAARGADSVAGAARLLRRGALLLAAACVVMSVSADVEQLLAIAALVAGTAVLSLAEMSQQAGSFHLSFELARAGQEGEYLGVFALGRGIQQFIGPVAVTFLVVDLAIVGWLVMAAWFLVLAVSIVPMVRMAAARRADQRSR